jgi:hypothetical protein
MTGQAQYLVERDGKHVPLYETALFVAAWVSKKVNAHEGGLALGDTYGPDHRVVASGFGSMSLCIDKVEIACLPGRGNTFVYHVSAAEMRRVLEFAPFTVRVGETGFRCPTPIDTLSGYEVGEDGSISAPVRGRFDSQHTIHEIRVDFDLEVQDVPIFSTCPPSLKHPAIDRANGADVTSFPSINIAGRLRATALVQGVKLHLQSRPEGIKLPANGGAASLKQAIFEVQWDNNALRGGRVSHSSFASYYMGKALNFQPTVPNTFLTAASARESDVKARDKRRGSDLFEVANGRKLVLRTAANTHKSYPVNPIYLFNSRPYGERNKGVDIMHLGYDPLCNRVHDRAAKDATCARIRSAELRTLATRVEEVCALTWGLGDGAPTMLPGSRVFVHGDGDNWRFIFTINATMLRVTTPPSPHNPRTDVATGHTGVLNVAVAFAVTVPCATSARGNVVFPGLSVTAHRSIWAVPGLSYALTNALNTMAFRSKRLIESFPGLRLPSTPLCPNLGGVLVAYATGRVHGLNALAGPHPSLASDGDRDQNGIKLHSSAFLKVAVTGHDDHRWDGISIGSLSGPFESLNVAGLLDACFQPLGPNTICSRGESAAAPTSSPSASARRKSRALSL